MNVYVITMAGQPYIKIGMTNDVSKRLATLQSASPFELSLYWSMPCKSSLAAHVIELMAHRELHACRIHGEWFHCQPDKALEIIECIASSNYEVKVTPGGDAKTFYRNTPKDELERVVNAAGIKMAYFRQIAYGYRKPSPEVTRKLVEFSGGAMTVEKLRPDFFGTEVAA